MNKKDKEHPRFLRFLTDVANLHTSTLRCSLFTYVYDAVDVTDLPEVPEVAYVADFSIKRE